jgi:hypothetical protein
VKLLRWETYLKSRSHFGQVSGGILKVNGPLLRAKLEIRPDPGSNWRRTAHIFSMFSTRGTVVKGARHTINKRRSDHYEKPIEFRPHTPLELRPIHSSSRWTFKRSPALPTEHPKAVFGEVFCLRFISYTVFDPDEINICMLVLGCLM